MSGLQEGNGLNISMLKSDTAQFEIDNMYTIESLLRDHKCVRVSCDFPGELELEANIYMQDRSIIPTDIIMNLQHFLEDSGKINMDGSRQISGLGNNEPVDIDEALAQTQMNIYVTTFKIRDYSRFLIDFNKANGTNLTLENTVRGLGLGES